MQRLTFNREFVLPIVPGAAGGVNPRGPVAEYYCRPPRGWILDSDASSVFRLQLYRGDWKTSRWLQPLAKTWLGRFFAVRRPLAVSAESDMAALATRPAELTVDIIPDKKRVRVTLNYCVYFASRKAEVSRDDRKYWKAAVEEDFEQLPRAIAAARAKS